MFTPARRKFARTRTTTGGFAFTGADIRILIVDEIEAWHCIYGAVLRGYPDRQDVAYALDAQQAIEKSRRLQPGVIMIALGPGPGDGFELARQISQASPDARLLFVGTAPPSESAPLALAAGAQGYISKRNVVVELIPALQAIAEGKRFVGQSTS